jgi:plastocyanin
MPPGRAARAGSHSAARAGSPRAAITGRCLGIAIAALGLALTACTNQQASINRRPHPGTATASFFGGVHQVTVSAGDTYRFNPSKIFVHPGTVQVTLHNLGKGAPHNLTFLDFGAATALTPGGSTRTVTFTAPSPGTYTYVCTIHRNQGQTGILVVLTG